MTIAGWSAPAVNAADAAPWFPIGGFPVAATNVDIRLDVAGSHVVGCLAIERGSGRLAWHERHRSGLAVPLMPWRHPSQFGYGLPRRYPSAWQPLDGFAHPLPAPLAGPVATTQAPIEPDAAPVSEDDGWPYPGLALGLGVPACREETEARVLRVLRTIEGGRRVGHTVSGISGDWSWELYEAMRRMQQILDAEEARARGERDNTIHTARSAWTPARRDHDDIPTVQAWVGRLTVPHARTLLLYRAANPPWSWRQIAEREHRRIGERTTCRAFYTKAIAQLHVIATRTPGDTA